MKLFSLGRLAVLLLPIGLGLALLGFWIENPGARTSLQVLGLLTLAVGVWLGQRLIGQLTPDAQ
jgi:hypothetical protein